VRDPDIALFGVDRLDPPEEELLRRVPIRSFPASEIQRKGAAATARLALERIHASRNDFVLHVDVDAIADFQATDYPGTSGLSLDDVRQALEVFTADKHLAAIDIAAYNPEKDPDGTAAKVIVEMLASVLVARRQALKASTSESANAAAASAPSNSVSGVVAETPASIPAAAAGEAWSSDALNSVAVSEHSHEENPGESQAVQPSDEGASQPAESEEQPS